MHANRRQNTQNKMLWVLSWIAAAEAVFGDWDQVNSEMKRMYSDNSDPTIY